MTRVFTPRSRSADIAAITAAAPDMSVFIVSMPPAVLSERPPESNTTPLPTSASVAFAPRGSYASRTKRGGAVGALADAEHAAEPLAFELLAGEHLDRSARLARDVRARAWRPSSGDFAPAGSFTRSRAHATASAMRAPRASAALHLGVRAPEHLTRATASTACASDLYVRNW